MTVTLTPSDSLLRRIQSASPVPRPTPLASPHDRRVLLLARKLGHLFQCPMEADRVTDVVGARLLIDALGLHLVPATTTTEAIGYPTGWMLTLSDLPDYADDQRLVVLVRCCRCTWVGRELGITRLYEVKALMGGHVCGGPR